MEQLIFFVGFPAVGFVAQFLLMRYTRRMRWRLMPTFSIIAIAVYGFLRGMNIIEYPWDVGGFIDAGPLIGLVILLCLIPVAIGALLGFIVDRIIVLIKKHKNKKKANRGLSL